MYIFKVSLLLTRDNPTYNKGWNTWTVLAPSRDKATDKAIKLSGAFHWEINEVISEELDHWVLDHQAEQE